MYAGRFVEVGRHASLFSRHAHPYTEALLSSIPTLANVEPSTKLEAIAGRPPDMIRAPSRVRVRAALHVRRSRGASIEDPPLRRIGRPRVPVPLPRRDRPTGHGARSTTSGPVVTAAGLTLVVGGTG